MDYMKEYERWLQSEIVDEETKNELLSIKDDKKEIEDRFYKDLSFGTAGLRGKLGAGTNRMNKYVVARATHALANVIESYGEDYKNRGIAIAYDCRIKSCEFAELAARIMATHGIKTYLFDSLRPTPELSFAIRHLNLASGINITASHNPKEYNGYKVYFEEGSQIKSDIADKVLSEIERLDIFENQKLLTTEEAKKKGLLEIIGNEIDEIYYKKILDLTLNNDIDKDLKIVYTPLNGAGNIPVREILKRREFNNVYIVKEQEKPDGTFPTSPYPNPENIEAMKLADKYALEIGADIVIATDPDSDRLAVQSVKDGEIYSFNGNQMGVLMIYYILSQRKEKGILPENAAIIKTIVTGNMGEKIAKDYDVKMFDVLTGFKNISELPNIWDKTKEYEYVFGYEESIGYNPSTFVRDKDAVSSAMILLEMAGFYKKQGKTLKDVLFELFEKYGYYQENTVSIVLEGIEGQKRIKKMMKEIRDKYPKEMNNHKIKYTFDYQESIKKNLEEDKIEKVDIEKTDAFKMEYKDGTWIALRPSGTEPKIKIYIYTIGENIEKAREKLNNIEKIMKETLENIK